MTRVPWTQADYAARCPECGTRGYLILPGHGDCKLCLAVRFKQLEQTK